MHYRGVKESWIGMNDEQSPTTAASVKTSCRIGVMKDEIRMSDDFDKWPLDMLESLGMK